MKGKLYWYEGIVESVYDGDSFRLEYLDIGFGIRRYGEDGRGFPVRLAFVDAPEIRGPERPQGLLVKEEVIKVMPVGSLVYLNTIKWSGKYGRWIADVYPHSLVDQSLSNYLLENNWAVEVDY